MNPRPEPRKMSLVSKVLSMTLVCLLGLLGALSYAVLGGGQLAQSYFSHSTAFQVTQFKADIRTVAGAISYLLEPESGDQTVDSEYGTSRGLSEALRKIS